MTTLRCDRCPSAAFCSCQTAGVVVPANGPERPKAIPVESLGSFGARVEAQTRPARVTPEQLARLEDQFYTVSLKLLTLERRLDEAKSLWDNVHADTRKRVTALESASRGKRDFLDEVIEEGGPGFKKKVDDAVRRRRGKRQGRRSTSVSASSKSVSSTSRRTPGRSTSRRPSRKT